jgi:fumarate hydratase subunit beta
MRELGDIPFDPKDQVIYYAAPTPKRPGEIIGSCGPTTSARMDPYTELFLSAGISGMVGKGPRAEYVVSLIKRFKAVYFVAIGGAACYLSQFIKDAEVIAYPDLLCEAVHKLFVEDLPLYVGIDFAGNSL